MIEDMIEEELQIMEEQDRTPKFLSSETFQLPISELKRTKVYVLSLSATIADAIHIMVNRNLGSVVIVDNATKVAGIVTERDILRKVTGKIDHPDQISITEIMTNDPLCLREDDMIAYVMNNMHVGGYRHIPIVNEKNQPIAMVSIKDVMGFILDHFPQEITNITDEPYRGPLSRESA